MYFEGNRATATTARRAGDRKTAQTMYMVTRGVSEQRVLLDYGNAETDNNDDGKGTMEALYWD